MSNDRRPVMRVTYKRGETQYNVLSIWPGKFPGSYSVSRDKPSEKYPTISLIDVIKAFVAGEGFVNVSVESQREPRDGGQRREAAPVDAGGAEFSDDDIPFAPRDGRIL